MGEQLKDGLDQAWNLVATFVPKLIGFLIILLIGMSYREGRRQGVEPGARQARLLDLG